MREVAGSFAPEQFALCLLLNGDPRNVRSTILWQIAEIQERELTSTTRMAQYLPTWIDEYWEPAEAWRDANAMHNKCKKLMREAEVLGDEQIAASRRVAVHSWKSIADALHWFTRYWDWWRWRANFTQCVTNKGE